MRQTLFIFIFAAIPLLLQGQTWQSTILPTAGRTSEVMADANVGAADSLHYSTSFDVSGLDSLHIYFESTDSTNVELLLQKYGSLRKALSGTNHVWDTLSIAYIVAKWNVGIDTVLGWSNVLRAKFAATNMGGTYPFWRVVARVDADNTAMASRSPKMRIVIIGFPKAYKYGLLTPVGETPYDVIKNSVKFGIPLTS